MIHLVILLSMATQLPGVRTSMNPQQMKMMPASFMSLNTTLFIMMSYPDNHILVKC